MIKEVLNFISLYTLPVIIVVILLWSIFKKVPVYETFISGAKEGFKVVSEPFLEDGIPHVQMEREITGRFFD